jgi:hypothetical protein
VDGAERRREPRSSPSRQRLNPSLRRLPGSIGWCYHRGLEPCLREGRFQRVAHARPAVTRRFAHRLPDPHRKSGAPGPRSPRSSEGAIFFPRARGSRSWRGGRTWRRPPR